MVNLIHHIRRSNALIWKLCQGDSLNLPDHRYIVGVAASFQLSRIHKPHAHTQAFKGQQDRGQGNYARGAGAAGYGRAQNKVGYANPGQARQIKCYNRNGGQDNVVDEYVDEQPVQDIALNVDNVFQELKVLQRLLLMQAQDNRVTLDEEQLLFIADPVYDEASPSYYSDVLSEDKAVQVIQSDVSVVPNDAYMMILNDMHEPPAQHDGPDQTTALLTKNENLKVQIDAKLKCVTTDSVTPKVLAPGMYAIDVEPIPPRLRNNREVHLDYLKHFKKSVATLREIVEEAKVERPLDISVASDCLYTKHSQELLEYKHVEQQITQKTNVLVLSSIGVDSCTDGSGSKPRRNTKKDRISSAKSVNKKTVEDHSRTNKSQLQKPNHVDSSISSKLKQVWKPKHVKKVWKASGKVLTTVGYQWNPKERIFTLGEQCPLTRFTHPKAVPAKQPENVSISKSVIIENSSHTSQKPLTRLLKTYDKGSLTAQEFHKKFIETVRFGNDHFDAIVGYEDYVIGDNVISRLYYMEGVGHNLFSVGQFCDSDLEVAFRKHSCYGRDTDGVELIKGEEGTQIYVLFPVLSDGSTNPKNNKDAHTDGKEHDNDVQKSVSPDFHSSSCGHQTRKQGGKAENKDKVNAAGFSISAAELNFTNSTNDFSAAGPSNAAMPNLEDLSHNADDVGAEADINNMESIISVSPILTSRIHKDHPTFQIIGDLSSTTQTRSMARGVRDQVYQMDVKSAFFYGIIEEEVYVCQLPGFKDPEYPDKVYKVVKALYGLHQAPRAWYETLATYLLENRFQRGTIDQTLFIKKQQKDILLVQIYVDDFIFGATNKVLCQSFEKLMKDKFQMSSMGELTFFLGLQLLLLVHFTAVSFYC
nr:putative ribonuclease H-like domain-containing protein [Tanacetum cinerariifolium]